MWLFYLIVALVWCRSGIAFPQAGGAFEADGFVFDGPASGSREGTTSQESVSPPGPVTRPTPGPTPTPTPAPNNLRFDQCVSSCPATPEYNPVCGSDTVNYDNPGRLSCAATCGKAVTLDHYGRCMTSKIRTG